MKDFKISAGGTVIWLNKDSMKSSGSKEKYLKTMSGLSSQIGVDEEELNKKLDEAYDIVVGTSDEKAKSAKGSKVKGESGK